MNFGDIFNAAYVQTKKKNKLLRFKEVREMAAMSSEHGMGGDRKRANGMLLCSTDQTRFQSNFGI